MPGRAGQHTIASVNPGSDPATAAARTVSSIRLAGLSLLAGAGAIAIGCTTTVPDYTPDADTGTTHAVVTIERSESALEADSVRADALAQFVSIPAYTEPDSALRVAGVVNDLPEADHCASGADFGQLEEPLSTFGPIEFLEAGEVTLSPDRSVATSLSPHAFPTVSDFASGVVYTTRDRDAAALPAAVPYRVTVGGSYAVPAIDVVGSAPGVPGAVTVSGVPLEEVVEVAVTDPIDLTWQVGEPGDLVYVELLDRDNASSVVCVFHDEEGAGTVPEASFSTLGPGRLSMHRLRISQFDTDGLSKGELRFDFEITTPVDFVE